MKTANESAFPQHGWSGNADTLKRMEDKQGLTKRELFAAMAMQGLLSNLNHGLGHGSDIGRVACDQADHLIAALASKEADQ